MFSFASLHISFSTCCEWLMGDMAVSIVSDVKKKQRFELCLYFIYQRHRKLMNPHHTIIPPFTTSPITTYTTHFTAKPQHQPRRAIMLSSCPTPFTLHHIWDVKASMSSPQIMPHPPTLTGSLPVSQAYVPYLITCMEWVNVPADSHLQPQTKLNPHSHL